MPEDRTDNIIERMFDGSDVLNPNIMPPQSTHKYSVRVEGIIAADDLSHEQAVAMRNMLRSTWGSAVDILESKTITASGEKLFSGNNPDVFPHVSSHVSSHVDDAGIVHAISYSDTVPSSPVSRIHVAAKTKRGNNVKVVERRYSSAAVDESVLIERGYHIIDRFTLRVLYTGTKSMCTNFIEARSSKDVPSFDRLDVSTIKICRYTDLYATRAELAKDFVAIDSVGGWKVVGSRDDVTKAVARRIKSKKIVNPTARINIRRVGGIS